MAESSITKGKDDANEWVVGIGASAGGLDAIIELYNNLPEDTNFSYVIVQHLSPDYKSLMAELLSKHTAMQVFEAANDLLLQPNCTYVIPSGKMMTLNKGMLKLEEKERTQVPNNAIDVFFESMAADKGKNAIGIILSGTGTDGTKGIEAIKSNGGMVIVQDPITAAFDGMPNSAISTGYADLILPPEMIPDEMIEYLKEAPLLRSYNELNQREEFILRDILDLIQKGSGYDFSNYKRPTINRRMAKRMAEKNIRTLREYSLFLQQNPDEVKAIAQEFLLRVTKFFRDEEAFEELRTKVIPALFSNKKPKDIVKIWVVACSTGDEAYSIAMLLQEYMEKNNLSEQLIKIFATDIDDEALEIASRGMYSEEAVMDVSKEFVQKYFINEGSMYKVIPLIRKMVVFAHHDIGKDPPYSMLDLITCRNMLIYMNSDLQKAILKAFHFALNKDGFLMLGPSENIGVLKDVLREIDKKWKIFRCEIKSRLSDYQPFLAPVERSVFSQYQLPNTKSKNALTHLPELFKETILEEYDFAGIFIDRDFDVKQAIGHFKKFISIPDNKFEFNLLRMVPPDLSIALGIALRKAMKENVRVFQKNVKIQSDNQERQISIIVKPYLDQKDYLQPFYFVILKEEEIPEKVTRKTGGESPLNLTSERIAELEEELHDTKENLKTIIEEVEAFNEELQSSNEEIVSANEELQSTNEELQSLNEELHTVNAEHQLKIKELQELNDDLNNYMRNSEIGQILVDKKLIIRKFSPVVTTQVNLIASDVGRSLVDITTNFRSLDLINNIKSVMKTEKSIEKEVEMESGKYFLMQIRPYFRQDKRTDGVVLNFINISEVKKLSGIIQGIFNSSISGIAALNAVRDKKNNIVDFEWLTVNNKVAEMLNERPENLIGHRMLEKYPDIKAFYFEDMVRVVERGGTGHFEYFREASGQWLEVVSVKMLDGLVMTFTDITSKKKAADLLAQGYEDLKITSGKLIATNNQLEQSNYDLMQFASVASHDLKEPLRKIQAFGNLFRTKVDGTLNPQDLNYLDKMINSAARMQLLIDDVLTFSKLSNKNIAFASCNLNTIFKNIIDDLEIAVKETNAEIRVDELPNIEGVPGQMHQLFQNFISNALKFNDKPKPVISVKEYKVEEKEAREWNIDPNDFTGVSVTDNGIGFEEQYSEKIFGIFQRLHGTMEYKGTGIGLAICKKIVENHKGFIKIHSKVKEGSAFIVVLPKKQPLYESHQADSQEEESNLQAAM
ncbi:MAG TPA: chemotaxis protein CheB [Chitinophagales bacterium]|nr:chemotaxis protein CheB [Chitinophagales bacterium]